MKPVHEMTSEELIAESTRREANRRAGRPLDYAGPELVSPMAAEQRAAHDARLEKTIEHAGDKQMQALGFRVIRFSQPRESKQTPGIPDRKYYHVERRLTLWWEAKSATGEQRPAQKDFQEVCEACGETYVLGTDQDLFAWLVEHGIAARTVGELLIALPYDGQQRRSA